jgi:hypothetical protein
MGRVLQVRLLAGTFDEEQVGRAWPRLHALAWPVGGGGPHGPAGVLELAAALEDQLRFGEWSGELKDRLGPGLKTLAGLRAQLEQALSDWQPQKASELSFAVEDGLDALEALAPTD